MKESIQIRCKNNKKIANSPIGASFSEFFSVFDCLAVRRAYTRSLFFVLSKAVHTLFENGEVGMGFSISNGYFCDLRIGREVTGDIAQQIKDEMQRIIDAALPIVRHGATAEYEIDGHVECFYDRMLENTGQLYLFGLEKYYDGLLLRIPSADNPAVLGEMIRQDKMFEVFREDHRWQEIMGVRTVADLNMVITQNHADELMSVNEALQEKRIAKIAEMIAERKDVRMVLIAGPSSSGKTTFCKRLSIQLFASGLKPRQISLDDYFVDRVKTPRDAKGDYDYESIHALNIPLLNEQLERLFAGEEVTLPRYNFQTGRSETSGRTMRLNANEVLVLEGIHALNPELTAQIPQEQKFCVYASALTTILLDTHNYIPTTDNRLLRRMIRDHKYRGVSAQETIRRWPSVRAGENKWIFPFQENADAMFNSAMFFELSVIRTQALPILESVPEDAPEYGEAVRLANLLRHFESLPEDSLMPYSLLREFVGGSRFKY